MRICCRFTVRSKEILLNYVGTPQWGPNGINFRGYDNNHGIIHEKLSPRNLSYSPILENKSP